MKTVQLFLMLCLSVTLRSQPYTMLLIYPSDVNHDGYADLLFSANTYEYTTKGLKTIFRSYDNTNRIFYGSAAGLQAKQAGPSDSAEAELFSKQKTDINNDGFPDLIYTSDTAISARYGSASGFRKDPVTVCRIDIPSRKDWSFFFFDYDGDGYRDILIPSNGHFSNYTTTETVNLKLAIIKGSSAGFSNQSAELVAYKDKELSQISGSDFNGDGKDDIFLSYPMAKGGYAAEVWLGGTGQDTAKKSWKQWPVSLFSTEKYVFYPAGDINGDGKKDIAVLKTASEKDIRKNNMAPCTMFIYAGFAGGLQAEPMLTLPLQQLATVAFSRYVSLMPLGDFDGDGLADLLGVSETGLLNGQYKSGIVTWGAADSAGVQNTTVAELLQFANSQNLKIQRAGDINADKMQDLVLYGTNKLFVVYGNKERSFIPVEIIF